ncbi:YbaB/EbfC family nucleoid-associated protein [Streptomyces viridiviolaceus]
MDRPGGSRLERVLADFAEQHGVVSRAREQLRALSVTALSRDGAVQVTVDADGRAAGIRFVGQPFRDMTAPQLGGSVMDALTTARSEVETRTTAVLATAGFRLPPSGPRCRWTARPRTPRPRTGAVSCASPRGGDGPRSRP